MQANNSVNKSNVIFPADAVRMLRNLPEAQRYTVTQAIVSAFVLGEDNSDNLCAFDKLVYIMVADTIRRGASRAAV